MEHKDSCLVFEYRYRDAGNYKIEGRVLLTGELTLQERNAIEEKMESGQFFVAEQVGIPSLCDKLFVYGGGPTAEDHAWHEFDSFQAMSADFKSGDNDVVISGQKLLSAFNSIECWKPELSPNF